MSDLSSFAEVIQKAIHAKQVAADVENAATINKNVPLLSELFASVAKAKVNQKVKPSLPDKAIVEEIPQIIKPDNVGDSKNFKDLENKLLKTFNKLQTDFQNLKKYVEAKSSRSVPSSSSGSGEVRILRMDDVDPTGLVDGSILQWNSTLNKFVLVSSTTIANSDQVPTIGGTTYFELIASSSGYIHIGYTFRTDQYTNGYSLRINGLLQSRDYYVVSPSGINISEDLFVETGDVIYFSFLK